MVDQKMKQKVSPRARSPSARPILKLSHMPAVDCASISRSSRAAPAEAKLMRSSMPCVADPMRIDSKITDNFVRPCRPLLLTSAHKGGAIKRNAMIPYQAALLRIPTLSRARPNQPEWQMDPSEPQNFSSLVQVSCQMCAVPPALLLFEQ